MDYINCQFSNPVNYLGEIPKDDKVPFQFKDLTCEVEKETMASPVVLVETESRNFWLNKSWTFGELFISFVLVVFLVVIISRGIWNFFYPQIVKIKRIK